MTTPSFSEKLLSKACGYWNETLANITPFPGREEFYKLTFDDVKEIVEQRRKLSFADGVCRAFAAIDTDAKKRKKVKA